MSDGDSWDICSKANLADDFWVKTKGSGAKLWLSWVKSYWPSAESMENIQFGII